MTDAVTQKWLDSLKVDPAKVGFQLAHDPTDPEAAAKNLRVGTELGLPSNIVGADPAGFERIATQNRNTKLLQDNPRTAKWLSDVQNSAIARDDVENLSWFEKTIVRGAERGVIRASAIPAEQTVRINTDLLLDLGKSYEDMYAEELAKYPGSEDNPTIQGHARQAASRRFDLLSQATPEMKKALLDKGAEALRETFEKFEKAEAIPRTATAQRFLERLEAVDDKGFSGAVGVLEVFAKNPLEAGQFLAETAAEFLPVLMAGTTVTAVTRSPVAGAVFTGGASGLIENASGAVEFLREQGVTISTPEDAVKVLENTELMQAAAERGLARGVVIGLMDALSGGVAGKVLMDSPAGNMVAQSLAQVLFGGAGEALAQHVAGQEFSWREVIIEGLAEFVTAPIEVLGVGGRGFLKQVKRVAETEVVQERLSEIDRMAAESKLRERSQEKFREALEAQGVDAETLYVPADELRELYQGEVPYTELGVDPNTFRAMEMSGGKIGVPMSSYAAHIANTDAAEWFAQNATLTPDEISIAEARTPEINEMWRSAVEEAQAVETGEREARASDVQIYDRMYTQLRDAGRTPDVAQREARVWSSFWRTMGERYGSDPMALAERMGVRVQRALSTETQEGLLNQDAPPRVGSFEQVPETGRLRGYRVVNLDDEGNIVSQADSRTKMPAKGTATAPVFLSNEPAYVIENYSNGVWGDGEPRQALATYDFSQDDVLSGSIEDRQPEISARNAELIDLKEIDSADTARALSSARTLFQPGAPLQSEPLPIDGSGPGGRVLNRDLGTALMDRHDARYDRPLDPDDPADYKVILDSAEMDYREQAAQPDNGEAWYVDDINEAIRITETVIPELADPVNRDLFLTMTALLSPQQKPQTNWENAVLAMQGFLKDGKIPLRKPNGKNFGVASHTTGLQLLQHLMDTKGLEGALQWVREPHTGREMAEIRRDSGLFKDKPKLQGYVPNETNLNETKLGIYMMGPKVGDFMQNSVGIDQDAVTVDLWMARTYNRLIGRLTDVPAKVAESGGLADQVRGRAERENIKRLVRDLAKRAKIDPSAMQAALWYFEQRLYRAHGIRSDSQNFSGAARTAASKRGISQELLDRGAGTASQDGGRILHQGPTSDAAGVRGASGGTAFVRGRTVQTIAKYGDTRRPIHEIEDPALFGDLIRQAKADLGPVGAQVTAYDDYDGMRLFVFDDGYSGFALSGDDIISVFSVPGKAPKGAVSALMPIAVAQGGRRLDGFDTFLPDLYAKQGFRAVARLGFSREHAPEGWDYDVMAALAERGEPDVVFMVYDPENASPETDNVVEDYDAGIAAQDAALEEITTAQTKELEDAADQRELAQGDERGSIQLPLGGLESGESVINLFENADLSTVLHESGHFFLEAFRLLADDANAPQAMRDDLDAILKFVGAKRSADGTLPAFTTRQHEKWAKGFEAYLMEGKAPSLELADAFSRFRAWLTRIYRHARGLNVTLTNEVRDVMDRMLATDQEIAEARAEQKMSPLFAEAPAGMSAQDFETYQRFNRRGKEQAEQRLLEKTMATVRREREGWYKKEKKAVRAEVAEEVTRRPEHRLVEMMANRKWHGDTERDVPDAQISREQLVEQFGEDVIPELSQTRLGGKRAIYGTGKNTISPNEAAEVFGFESAGEMVETLKNTGKLREVIDTETDRRMLERYGDPLNDGSIEEEALEAIHSDQQVHATVVEARHMAAQLGRSSRGLTARAYKVRAQAMIGQMSVKNASRPDQFLQAERRAAQRAQKAFAQSMRKGGEASLTEAFQAKEQQILNMYLYREAKVVAEEVQKGRERMRSYDKKSVREKLDGGYIEQIDTLLEDYEFRVRSQRQIARAERLDQYVNRMIEEGREAELAIDQRLIDDARKIHYTKMSVDELRGLFDTIKNIDHMGRFKQKLIDARKQRDLAETIETIETSMDEHLKDRPPNRTELPGERRRRDVRDYLNLTLNADTHLRELDGFKNQGPAWTAIKADVDAGMSRMVERRMKMAREFEAIYDRYSSREKREMAVKRHNDALGGLFSKWDVIAVALNTGNEENYARLTNPRTPGGFTPAQVDAALAALDERDWGTVQSIWDYINSFWPEIEAKEKRTTGVAPKKVAARLMVEAPASVRGGYYPIKYDSRLSTRTTEQQTKELFDRMRAGRFGKAQTRKGHTEERKQNVKMPLVLDLAVAHAHVQNVIYDLELGEAVNNGYRVLTSLTDKFREKGKAADHEALEIWMQDVASGEQISARGFEKYQRYLRSGFIVSRLALNLSTVLIQPTGLAQSAVLIGKRATAKGTIDYISHMSRWVSDVEAVSPLMRERQKTFERDIFNVVGDLQGGPVTGRWAKFQRDVILPLSFLLMQKVQYYAVDMPTWVSAYQRRLGETNGDEAKAREYADLMVRRTQGSGLMSDRGMMERGTTARDSRQRELPRTFTALGSYMFAKGNVAYERTMATNFKSPVEAMKWAVDMGLLFTLEAVLYSAAKGFLPDEDEDWGTWLAAETGFSVMSTVPGLREVSSGLQDFGTGGILGSMLEGAFVRPVVQAKQGELDRAAVKAAINAGGIWLHLPAAQTNAIVNGVFEDDMRVRRDPDVAAMLGIGGEDRNSLIEFLMERTR